MARHLQLALVMVLSFVVPGDTVIAQCNGSLGGPAVVNNAYDTTCPEISQITSFRATGSMACREIGFNVQASEEVSYADEAKGVCSEDPPWICTYISPYAQVYMNVNGNMEMSVDHKDGIRNYGDQTCELTDFIGETIEQPGISECGGPACCAGGPACENNGDRWFPEQCRCAMSPLFVVLQGPWDSTLTGASRGVPFVMRPGTPPNLVSWTHAESHRAALLVRDRNGNARIDDGSELYGGATPQVTPKGLQRHGFTALATEDADSNGWVDARDSAYGLMALWFDLNHNGISESEELVALSDAGVVRISVRYDVFEKDDRNGNTFAFVSAMVAQKGGRTFHYRVFDVYPKMAAYPPPPRIGGSH